MRSFLQLLLVAALVSHHSTAAALAQPNKTLAYINGVGVNERDAETRTAILGKIYRDHLGLSDEDFYQEYQVVSLHNPTQCPDELENLCLPDLFEAAEELGLVEDFLRVWEFGDLLFWLGALELLEHDLMEAAQEYSLASQAVIEEEVEKLSADLNELLMAVTGPVVIVAHSQGNLHANRAWENLAGRSRVHIIAVATPSSEVGDADGRPYITTSCDLIPKIVLSSLRPNILTDFCSGTPLEIACEINCHAFQQYLTGSTSGGRSQALLMAYIDEAFNQSQQASGNILDQLQPNGELEENTVVAFCGSTSESTLAVGLPVDVRIFGSALVGAGSLDMAFEDCVDIDLLPSPFEPFGQLASCTPVSAGEKLLQLSDLDSAEILCQVGIGVREPDPPSGPLTPRAIGPETQVNDDPIGLSAQATPLPDLAALPGRGFVIVWAGDSPDDPTATVIFARIYDEFGQPIGPSFVASVGFDSNIRKQRPSVAVDVTGNILVAWTEDSSAGPTFQQAEIRGRWFDGAGEPLSSRFTINLFEPGIQRNVDVAAWGSQQAVAVWENSNSGSINMQPLGPNGPFPGIEFDIVVNQSGGTHIIPRVDAAPDGEFVVAWAQAPGTIRARRFESDGNPLSGEITEISPPNGSTFPDVQVANDHSFVVLWRGSGSFVRFYEADDQPVSTALQLPQNLGEGAPSFGLDQSGTIVVVARSTFSGSPQVVAQRFSPGGESLEEAFIVNSLPSNSQSPRVAVHPSGEFAVTWYSCCSSSVQPVWARMYELTSP